MGHHHIPISGHEYIAWTNISHFSIAIVKELPKVC